MMSQEPWLETAVKEIEDAIKRGKRLRVGDKRFFENIQERTKKGIGITQGQHEWFWNIYKYITEPVRTKW